MRHRILERAAAAGVGLTLLVATAAFADTVRGDADAITAGIQASLDLGDVAPGAVLDVPVAFRLACKGSEHVDPSQRVVVELVGGTVPPGGSVAMDAVTLGPVPATWPADQGWCDGDESPVVAVGSARITAPAATGFHLFSLAFTRTLVPQGVGDAAALDTVPTAADFTLTVVAPPNTAPVLLLPDDMTVVADGPAGWTASYAVAATDAEDDPDPTPSCTPSVGRVLPVGATTVQCSVTDSGDLTTSGSFDVTVEAKAPAPEPRPEPTPVAPPTALFGAPVKAGSLDGRAGRTVPLKVRLVAGEVPVGEGALDVVVSPCAGGDPVATVALEWRADAGRWFGLLRTRGLAAGCYAVRAMRDGADVGGFELHLLDRQAEVAKANASVGKQRAAPAREKDAARVKAAPVREKVADTKKASAGSPGAGAGGPGHPKRGS